MFHYSEDSPGGWENNSSTGTVSLSELGVV